MADILANQSPDAAIDAAANDGAADAAGREGAPIYTEAERLEQDRRNMIRALEAANWRVSGEDGAAALVGLKSSTFTDRMKKFAIERPN